MMNYILPHDAPFWVVQNLLRAHLEHFEDFSICVPESETHSRCIKAVYMGNESKLRFFILQGDCQTPALGFTPSILGGERFDCCDSKGKDVDKMASYLTGIITE